MAIERNVIKYYTVTATQGFVAKPSPQTLEAIVLDRYARNHHADYRPVTVEGEIVFFEPDPEDPQIAEMIRAIDENHDLFR